MINLPLDLNEWRAYIYKGQCNSLVCFDVAAAQYKRFEYLGDDYNALILFEIFAERCEPYYLVVVEGTGHGYWRDEVYKESCVDW